jgi:hypothetical protein
MMRKERAIACFQIPTQLMLGEIEETKQNSVRKTGPRLRAQISLDYRPEY